MKNISFRIRQRILIPWPFLLISICVFIFSSIDSLLWMKRLHMQYQDKYELSICNMFVFMFSGYANIKDIRISEMLRWLIRVSPPILFTGYYLSIQINQRLYYVLIRKRSIFSWWNECLLTIVLYIIYYVFIGIIIMLITLMLNGMSIFFTNMEIRLSFTAAGLFMFYLIMIASLQCFMVLAIKNIKPIIFILTSIPVLSALCGYISPEIALLFPGNWGMFARSDIGRQYYCRVFSLDQDNLGFSPAIIFAIETLMIIFLTFADYFFLKYKEIKLLEVE